jgi:23S rRNA pseudouridine1911/1915/1917 synthase
MPHCTKTLEVTDSTPEETRKIDRAVQALTGLSRRQIVGLFDQQCVQLNGALCQQPWQRLAIGDLVAVTYDTAKRYQPRKRPPRHLGFDILFEDEHVIVVNKPAGWLTVPTPKREQHTLIQRISDYLTQANRRRRVRVQAVQRLDRGVSGVLVFAKTNDAAVALRAQFQEHAPERQYVAVVAGRMVDDAGTFRSHLATNKALKRYSTTDEAEGELAVTHYEVERRWPDATVVRVWLETGRRNQIRVHFAEAGHPVLGDERYEHEQARHPRWKAKRLALHATRLSFRHPVTGQEGRFDTALPPEFQTFLGAQQLPPSIRPNHEAQ